ncbi:MAG: DUF167 domain-containing protein [Alphaproteobacteria bacterium]|nr:DUF167 domain-containing protein [Alphaproteobacteria bacterium]
MVLEQNQQGIVLRVRLTPNSSCCKINGVFDDTNGDQWLKICVVSVPEKGKANKELFKFLAKELHLPKTEMKILSGELDRYKKILMPISEDMIRNWLKGYGI